MDSKPGSIGAQLSICQAELQAALKEAEENALLARAAQEELQFFVYAASHDLQQPLRAVGTYAQLLQREFSADERAREFTAVIVDGVAQINTLIRDLVTYSRTGNSAQRSCINLDAPLQWALFNLADAIEKSGAQVTGSDLPTEAYADEKLMVNLFEQLIGNAIKFRGTDPPKVEVFSQNDGDFHTVSVRDNGVGIKPEYHEKIFEPFKRLHSKDIPGTGLGLSICRKILRAHHGKIWAESDGGPGSVFKFTVPI